MRGIGQYHRMTKERWEGIIRFRNDLLAGKKVDWQTPYLPPEILSSWKRCLAENLDMNSYDQRHPIIEMDDSAMDDALIGSIPISSLMSIFEDIPYSDDFPPVFFMLDIKGNVLYRNLKPSEAARSELFKAVAQENIIGTTANSLAKLYKRPFQLQGPEHFCNTLGNSVGTCVPIFDTKGEMVAALTTAQLLNDTPWDDTFQNLCFQTFQLVTLIAAALESRLHFEEKCSELEKANSRLETTMSIIDESIITIDRQGNIIGINNEGCRIFSRIADDLKPTNICKYLLDNSRLMAAVNAGQSADFEEALCINGEIQSYLIACRPILKKGQKTPEGAVLQLNPTERINKQSAVRAGSSAVFTFENIMGQNSYFEQVKAVGKKVAASPENVLLVGESGTGKELFAQAIHNSYRPNGPFVAINCAAIPRELIESELFGYEGGSFTGANRKGRPGKIELANDGTLFLDEIGDMPLEVQPVLLRVLQNNEVTRIGGSVAKKINFRVIAATNKNPLELIEKKMFREDLYYRLSVFYIYIPALRERRDDIPHLCRYFIKNYCRKMRKSVPELSIKMENYLQNLYWPGNIRQLEHAIIYAVNMADGSAICPEHLPPDVTGNFGKNTLLEKPHEFKFLKTMEKKQIEDTLINNHNNVRLAAEKLGICKSTMYRKLKEYNIDF
ncbi:MAG: sigma 54-interacting transcriptional regulator [Dehalobacter sp.]|nr:sigma 54-interacting transcriptional regulator [Dehalobacter sp.]